MADLPVYRMSQGKRVRVPGDAKRSDKLYSHVADAQSGEHYLLELTDEEQQQRENEAKEWEANRPQRDTERAQRERMAEELQESLVYQDRLIAFVDILGWSQMIEMSRQSPAMVKRLGSAISALAGRQLLNAFMQKNEIHLPHDPQFTQFSDCIVISCLAEANGLSSRTAFESDLSFLVHHATMLGLVVRGGVVRDQLCHIGSLVYGPGLVNAYQLESTVAVTPRIVLSQILAEQWLTGIPIFRRSGTLITHDRRWITDQDGRAFFDFLSPNVLLGAKDTVYVGNMKSIKPIIKTGLNENAERIRAKYVWLARYFNEALTSHPVEGLAPI